MARSLWRLALSLVAATLALSARAEVFSYEIVNVAGPNNVVDSNASSCDSVEGCYTRAGNRCSDDPNQLCDLQIVPAGRCTHGNLGLGLESCVWPHRAGRCVANIKVGCLTTNECRGLTPTTCDTTVDKYGRVATPADPAACTCTNATAAAVCGGALSVCSDGDPTRGFGGLGLTLGMELKLGGPGSQTFAGLGPSVTGEIFPRSSPVFEIENPPSSFAPQRDAGTVGRGVAQGVGPIHPVRITQARELDAYAHPTIADPNTGPASIKAKVRKMHSYGDSYWEDWIFTPYEVTGTFNTHQVFTSCDPPVGWVMGTPVAGALHCHQAARNGVTILWSQDLTPAQKTAYTSAGVPVCPPHCYKDFDLSTMEVQAFSDAGLLDPNAAMQLAIQSGEVAASRVAGARDAIGVDGVTMLTWLVDNDMRCRLGGWGNAPGFIGRCNDGPSACDPDAVNCGMGGGGCCPGQGGSCRA